ncbi:pentapeptide repeat-containing protein [Actinobacillus equuli]|uniref:pentapeptide repeat-containing protein n=1 Tax=Actinobacillus equuli TaxID=718 RepID=UPI00244298A4|nr:pentapeptide repeat-containing protein [Actinobacillus equuli]WGE41845.1 pentapeptide repeat-containing protein [Actinobacillus equuli subsp. haemolyticus]
MNKWFKNLISDSEFHCNKMPNWLKVIFAAMISGAILLNPKSFVELLDLNFEDVKTLNSFWTIFTLIASAPVAFIIWHFRDQNISQQIENARKDTNLKEFQKLAEWVSGVHLVEDKVTMKTQWKEENGEEKKVIEEIREYHSPSPDLSIQTYSKRDGAVGLQIAAVYNLLPFFRGEHGEGFRKPSLNLLLSAWKAIHNKELNKLKSVGILHNIDQTRSLIDKITENGRSELAKAITHVLLDSGGKYFIENTKGLSNICLAGMDFSDPSLDSDVFKIFSKREYLQSYDFTGADLRKMSFDSTKLHECDFSGCFLGETTFLFSYLSYCDFNFINANQANFKNCRISCCDFLSAKISSCSFQSSTIDYTKFNDSDIFHTNFSESIWSANNIENTNFEGCFFKSTDLQNQVFNDSIKIDYSSFELANLRGVYLLNKDLSNVNLKSAFLGEATFSTNILSARSLLATRLYLSDLNGCVSFKEISEIKDKGAIILVDSEKGDYPKYIKCTYKKNGSEFVFSDRVWVTIDIDRTKLENPDWLITFE